MKAVPSIYGTQRVFHLCKIFHLFILLMFTNTPAIKLSITQHKYFPFQFIFFNTSKLIELHFRHSKYSLLEFICIMACFDYTKRCWSGFNTIRCKKSPNYKIKCCYEKVFDKRYNYWICLPLFFIE